MTEGREASRLGQFSWALFDWANQPFFTVVTTFIFAPYFANVMIGDPVKGQAAWAFTQSTSGILIALHEPVPRRHGRRRRPAQTLHLLLPAACWRIGCAALWWAYPEPARSRRADRLGGGAGDGRRGDVDRVQQCAAAQHRAARAHGLAERLRLGAGLCRRPDRAARIVAAPAPVRRCGPDPRPHARAPDRPRLGAVAGGVRDADVPVHAGSGARTRRLPLLDCAREGGSVAADDGPPAAATTATRSPI